MSVLATETRLVEPGGDVSEDARRAEPGEREHSIDGTIAASPSR